MTDTERFISTFNDQLQQVKSRKLMLERFGQLLGADKDLKLSASDVSGLVALFRSETHPKGEAVVTGRTTLVGICRRVLTEYFDSLKKTSDPEPDLDPEEEIEDGSDAGSDTGSEAGSEESFDEEMDMKADINDLIEERFPELKRLSEKARNQLDELVLEMVDRYRL